MLVFGKYRRLWISRRRAGGAVKHRHLVGRARRTLPSSSGEVSNQLQNRFVEASILFARFAFKRLQELFDGFETALGFLARKYSDGLGARNGCPLCRRFRFWRMLSVDIARHPVPGFDCPRKARWRFRIHHHVRPTSPTLHEEANCEDCDDHHHDGFNYCRQRHWNSPLRPGSIKQGGHTTSQLSLFSRHEQETHQRRCIAEVTTPIGLTLLAWPCLAKGAP
jgi:hypothetical protein